MTIKQLAILPLIPSFVVILFIAVVVGFTGVHPDANIPIMFLLVFGFCYVGISIVIAAYLFLMKYVKT